MGRIVVAENQAAFFIHILKTIFVYDELTAGCGGENRQFKDRQVNKRDTALQVYCLAVRANLFFKRGRKDYGMEADDCLNIIDVSLDHRIAVRSADWVFCH